MPSVVIVAALLVVGTITRVEALSLGWVVAIGAMTILTVVFNFLLIKAWTFKDNRWGLALTLRQLFKFYSISVTGLLFNLGLFFLIHDVAGVGIYIAQTLAIIAVAPIHFFLNRYFTFRTDPAAALTDDADADPNAGADAETATDASSEVAS